MRIRGSTEEFVTSVHDVDKLLSVLADRDALEASLYRDIVKSRLDAIKEFQGIVDEDDKEKVLQKYLFDHLWLLDPAWERATDSAIMESRLIEEGVITDDLTEKEKLGRVDIAYRTNAGKHIIVELKRAGRKMKLLDSCRSRARPMSTSSRRYCSRRATPRRTLRSSSFSASPWTTRRTIPTASRPLWRRFRRAVVSFTTTHSYRGRRPPIPSTSKKSKELDRLDKIVDRI